MWRRGGKLTDQIVKKDPWAGMGCGRANCWVCNGGDERQLGKCVEEGVVYRIICLGCLVEGRSASYIGETSRSLFLRIQEHMSGFSSRSKGNVLWEHCREWHESREVLFKFEMVRKLFTALTRQVCEAVTIKCNKDDVGMNRKDEWNGAGIPNLVVQVRDKSMEENKETRNRPVRREPPEKDMVL